MNILEALLKFKQSPSYKLPSSKDVEDVYDNSMQEMGSGLEGWVKRLFMDDNSSQNNHPFLYHGAASRPPDLIVDNPPIAFEVKKIQDKSTSLQLNSSTPEQNLRVNNTRISVECKKIFDEKNIGSMPLIYVIGRVLGDEVVKTWIVDGGLYCAHHEVYDDISNKLKQTIEDTFPDNIHETNEIANFQGVDPLKITILRVRGMWIIKHPEVVFQYLKEDGLQDARITCLLSEETYKSCIECLPSEISVSVSDYDETSCNTEGNLISREIKVKSPDNPAKFCDAYLIQI